MSNEDVIQYQPKGTCSQMMQVKISDNKIVDADFYGGCNGNLKGISALVKGLSCDEVKERLSGIRCGLKPTSCPDQLAKAIDEAMAACSR